MGARLEQLATNGCAEHVAAWATGQNLAIGPEQLNKALGSEQVQQMAAAAGQPAEDFLKSLSDHLSSNGTAQPAANS
jgi:uncharacterized protein YidB (DUF937 family)